jgi:hypothetical protein
MEQCRVMQPSATPSSGQLQTQHMCQYQHRAIQHQQLPVASVTNPYDAPAVQDEHRLNTLTPLAIAGSINGKAAGVSNDDASMTQPTIGAVSAEFTWTQHQPEVVSDYAAHWRDDDSGEAMKQTRVEPHYRQSSPAYRRPNDPHTNHHFDHRDEQFFFDHPQQFSFYSLCGVDYTTDSYNVAPDTASYVHYYNI